MLWTASRAAADGNGKRHLHSATTTTTTEDAAARPRDIYLDARSICCVTLRIYSIIVRRASDKEISFMTCYFPLPSDRNELRAEAFSSPPS